MEFFQGETLQWEQKKLFNVDRKKNSIIFISNKIDGTMQNKDHKLSNRIVYIAYYE